MDPWIALEILGQRRAREVFYLESLRHGRVELELLEIVGKHDDATRFEQGHTGEHPVIGVSFDGTGYGDDGAIWGSEFLLTDFEGYDRIAHLDYIPLLGGDKAIHKPWRLALAWPDQAGIHWDDDLSPVKAALTPQRSGTEVVEMLHNQIQTGFNSPPTSSMGRLFDAVAALAGIRQRINYEAQAATEMEVLVDPNEGGYYPFDVSISPNSIQISPIPVIESVVKDLRAHTSVGIIAARFHAGVADMVLRVSMAIRKIHQVSEVALSGGVWQNVVLLRMTLNLLQSKDFTVPGRLGIEFDGSDPNAPFNGAYSASGKMPLVGEKRWKTANFKLDSARFLNSQNAGADMRIVAETAEFGVGKITLNRR